MYRTGYTLYAHPPGEPRERSRQQEYAAWIAANIDAAPARVLDVGCGNGSLLLALRRHWPDAEMLGCDPSGESIEWGAEHGLRLWQSTGSDLPASVAADVVVSVNVVEHTVDPLAFVRGLRGALSANGRLVLVCPDGETPGVELLFADHLFSFSSSHLEALLGRADLQVVTTREAPASLGAFRMVAARAGEHEAGFPERVDTSIDDRRAYLTRWQQLDARLQQRVGSSAICFGASEAAALLRAYAPATWSSIEACVVDGVTDGRFGELPLIPLDRVNATTPILLGVRPADQPRLAARLRSQFANVVTWYDLIDGA